MPAASTSKKNTSARTSAAKKTGAVSASKKNAVKADPYDDPFAASDRPAKTKKTQSKSSSAKSPAASSKKKTAKTKKIQIEENPLGMMSYSADLYDDPWAEPEVEKKPRRSPTRAKRPASDPYDDPWAAPAQKNPRKASTRVSEKDPYDDPWASPAQKKPRKTSAKVTEKDPLDDPWATPAELRRAARDKKGGSRGKKRGSGGGRKGGYITFLLSTMIVLCVLFISLQLYNYSRFITMRNAVEGEDFFAGTTIDGIDISGMTMDEAIAHWENNIEPGYYGRTVTLDNGMSVTANELGYSSNYKTVIETVWKNQTSGRLADRYAALTGRSGNGSGYSVERTLYTDDAVAAYTDKVASGIDSSVKEPSITGFDHDNMCFTFGEGKSGYTLDREKLASDMKTVLTSGGGSVALSVSTTQPKYTVDDMKNMYGLRAYAVTNASSSSSSRLTNIGLACNSINGTLLKPGEEFSFNEVVGKRTKDRGYKAAPAYNSGEVVEEVGGGICQVSTTLFNAVVKSDLKVTERHNHSMPVSYVDKGKDAAVSWGAQDLKFVNNSSEPVYIVAYLDDDKRVRIGVFGRLLDDGRYITVEAKLTYTKEFETVYQYNAFLLPGTQAELQSGRNTYEAMAYKCTWTADGELISREELCKSAYRGRDQIIEYGP